MEKHELDYIVFECSNNPSYLKILLLLQIVMDTKRDRDLSNQCGDDPLQGSGTNIVAESNFYPYFIIAPDHTTKNDL